MPTNDERREVAAKLRAIDDTEWTHPRDELRALDEAIGTSQGMPYAIQATWERLADLIEPEPERTCQIEMIDTGNEAAYEHYEHIAHCHSCHHEFGYVLYNEDGDTWQDEKPNYCPNCGAKVAKE